MKSRLLNAGLLALAILASAGLFELGVRLLFPAFDPSGHVRFIAGSGTRPTLGPANASLRQVKNSGDYDVNVEFNCHGFRDKKDFLAGRAEDVFVVGDSFSFGWGVEARDRYSNRLADLSNLKVFNISIPGNLEHYEKLLSFVAAEGACVGRVVLGLTMENDIIDYAPKPAGRQRKEGGEPEDSGLVLASVKGFLLRNSAAYFFATSAIHRSPALKSMAVKLGLVVSNLSGVHRSKYRPAAVASSLSILKRLSRRYPITVLLIPSRALWIGPDQADARRIHEAVLAGLKSAGIGVVDLRPRFERGGAPLSFHFANDGHWNPSGHGVAARELSAALAAAPPSTLEPKGRCGDRSN